MLKMLWNLLNKKAPSLKSPDLELSIKSNQSSKEKPNNSVRIFFSYGHDGNQELVLRIKADIESRGHSTWIDSSKIKAGDDWRREITEGIQASDFVLFFLSKHSTRDPGVCREEIAIANNIKHVIVQPILIEGEQDVIVPDNLEHIQRIDMHGWKQRQSTSLVEWEKWYRGKLDEIIAVLENEENQEFLLEIKKLKEYLKFTTDVRILDFSKKRFVGRGWLHQTILVWHENDRNSRIFWIKGDPGIGKSAFAAHLSQCERNKVIAVHFCEYDKQHDNTSQQIIKNLAFQIAAHLPDYRKHLLDILDVTELHNKNAAELFDVLLVNPLRNTIAGSRKHYLIIIDALDEASSKGLNALSGILARHAQSLPDWIGILITSRPEMDVSLPLQPLAPFILENSLESNREDIRCYLRSELASYWSKYPYADNIIERILEKSEGLFLYIEYFCKEITLENLSLDNSEQFPQGLAGIYSQYFERQFPDNQQSPNLEFFRKTIRPLLRAILAAREPISKKILRQVSGLRAKEELDDLLRILGSLFAENHATETIKPFHSSLAEWLLMEAKAGQYFIDKLEGDWMLSEWGWQEFGHLIHRKSMNNVHFPGVLLDLPYHLLRTSEFDKAYDVLTHVRFLSAKIKGGRFSVLLNDLSTLHDALNDFIDPDENLTKKKITCRVMGNVLARYENILSGEPVSLANQLVYDLSALNAEIDHSIIEKIRQAIVAPIWLELDSIHGQSHSNHLATTAITQGYIHFLQFSPDGTQLLYIDAEGRIVRWNRLTGDKCMAQAPKSFAYHDALYLSDRQLFIISWDFNAVFETDSLWEGPWTKINFYKLPQPCEGRLGRAVFNPIKRHILQTRIDSNDNGIIHYDLDGFKLKSILLLPALYGREGSGNHLSVSPDGQHHAICLANGSIAVSNGWHGKVFSTGAFCCEFLDNQHVVACGLDSFAVIINIQKGLIDVISFVQDSAADYLAVHPNGREIVIAQRSGMLNLIEWAGSLLDFSLAMAGVVDQIRALTFSQCGRYLAVSGIKKLRILDYEELKKTARAPTVEGRNIARPLQKLNIVTEYPVCLLLDSHAYLYSSYPDADWRYFPKQCGSFCINQGRLFIAEGATVILSDLLTGVPITELKIRSETMIRNMSMSEDGHYIVLDRSVAITIFQIADNPMRFIEINEIPLAELLEDVSSEYALVSNQPLVFCNQATLLAIPCSLPREVHVKTYANGRTGINLPDLNHQLCLVDVFTGLIRHRIPYQGFCTSLCEIPNHHCIALGVGYGPMMLQTDNGEGKLNYFSSGETDIHFYSLETGQELFTLPPIDMDAEEGVTGMAYDSLHDLLFVTFRAGQLGIASVGQRQWISSLCFADRLFGLAIEPDRQRVWLADQGENSVYPMMTALNYDIHSHGEI